MSGVKQKRPLGSRIGPSIQPEVDCKPGSKKKCSPCSSRSTSVKTLQRQQTWYAVHYGIQLLQFGNELLYACWSGQQRFGPKGQETSLHHALRGAWWWHISWGGVAHLMGRAGISWGGCWLWSLLGWWPAREWHLWGGGGKAKDFPSLKPSEIQYNFAPVSLALETRSLDQPHGPRETESLLSKTVNAWLLMEVKAHFQVNSYIFLSFFFFFFIPFFASVFVSAGCFSYRKQTSGSIYNCQQKCSPFQLSSRTV